MGLISTGGVLRRGTESLVGPGAEATPREIRASKLFLQAEGVSSDFGLSQNNVSEVTIKQKMIQSARRVILLADHTCFGRDEVAPDHRPGIGARGHQRRCPARLLPAGIEPAADQGYGGGDGVNPKEPRYTKIK